VWIRDQKGHATCEVDIGSFRRKLILNEIQGVVVMKKKIPAIVLGALSLAMAAFGSNAFAQGAGGAGGAGGGSAGAGVGAAGGSGSVGGGASDSSMGAGSSMGASASAPVAGSVPGPAGSDIPTNPGVSAMNSSGGSVNAGANGTSANAGTSMNSSPSGPAANAGTTDATGNSTTPQIPNGVPSLSPAPGTK
jgi:hypothetical protein